MLIFVLFICCSEDGPNAKRRKTEDEEDSFSIVKLAEGNVTSVSKVLKLFIKREHQFFWVYCSQHTGFLIKHGILAETDMTEIFLLVDSAKYCKANFLCLKINISMDFHQPGIFWGKILPQSLELYRQACGSEESRITELGFSIGVLFFFHIFCHVKAPLVYLIRGLAWF